MVMEVLDGTLESRLRDSGDPLRHLDELRVVLEKINTDKAQNEKKTASTENENIVSQVVLQSVYALLGRKDLDDRVAARVNAYFGEVIKFAVSQIEFDNLELVDTLSALLCTTENEFYIRYGQCHLQSSHYETFLLEKNFCDAPTTDVSGRDDLLFDEQTQASNPTNTNASEKRDEQVENGMDSGKDRELETSSKKKVKGKLDLSLFLLENVELFCNLGGIDLVMSRLLERKADRRPDIGAVRRYICLLTRVCALLHWKIRRVVAQDCKNAVKDCLLNLSKEQLKRTDKLVLSDTVNQLYSLCCLISPTCEIEEEIEKLNLAIAMQQFKCSFLQQRISGLNSIRLVVDRVQQQNSQSMNFREAESNFGETNQSPATTTVGVKRPRYEMIKSRESERDRFKRDRSHPLPLGSTPLAVEGLEDDEDEDEISDVFQDEMEVKSVLSDLKSGGSDCGGSLCVEVETEDVHINVGLCDDVSDKERQLFTATNKRNTDSPVKDRISKRARSEPQQDQNPVGIDKEPELESRRKGHEQGQDKIESSIGRLNSARNTDNPLPLSKYSASSLGIDLNAKSEGDENSRICKKCLRQPGEGLCKPWLNAEHLSHWMCKDKLIENLFSPGQLHTELLKRGREVCCFLAMRNKISEEQLQLIWDACAGRSIHESVKDACYAILEDLTSRFDEKRLNYLWQKISSIPPSEHDNHSLSFIRRFIINAANTQYVSSNGERNKDTQPSEMKDGSQSLARHEAKISKFSGIQGLDLLWKLVQDDSNCSIEIYHKAIKHLMEMAVQPFFLSHRLYMIQKCVDNIVRAKSVTQSLNLFRNLTSDVEIVKRVLRNIEIKDLEFEIVDNIPDDITHGAPDAKQEVIGKKLVRAVLLELVFYKTKCAQAHLSDGDSESMLVREKKDCQKTLVVEAVNQRVFFGKASYISGLKDRLDFLSFLLNRKIVLSLSQVELDLLWKTTAQNPLTISEYDFTVTWFKRTHELITVNCYKLPIERNKSQQIAEHALINWFPTLTLDNLRIAGFSFFQYFFFVTNQSRGSLIYQRPLVNKDASKSASIGDDRKQKENAKVKDEAKGDSKLCESELELDDEADDIFQDISFSEFNSNIRQTTKHSLPNAFLSGDDAEVVPAKLVITKPSMLVGMGLLWSIALGSKFIQVAHKAILLIKYLYESSQIEEETKLPSESEDRYESIEKAKLLSKATPETWKRNIPDDLLEGGFIREVIAQLKAAVNGKSLKEGSIKKKDKDRIGRCLILFQVLVESHRESHGRNAESGVVGLRNKHDERESIRFDCCCENNIDGDNASDRDSGDVVRICVYYPPKAVRKNAGDKPIQNRSERLLGTYYFDISKSVDVSDLEMIAKEYVRPEVEVSMFHGSRELSGNGTLSSVGFGLAEPLYIAPKEANLNGKQSVQSQLLHNLSFRSKIFNGQGQEPNGVDKQEKTDSNALLSRNENVELLFNIIETEMELNNASFHSPDSIASRAWDLLMLLPTNPSLLRRMVRLESDWVDTIKCSNVYKLLYSLQTMRTFFLKSDKKHYVGFEEHHSGKQGLWDSLTWSCVAVQNKVLENLLELLLNDNMCFSAIKSNNPYGEECLALLLELIHIFLKRHRWAKELVQVFSEKGLDIIYCLFKCIKIVCTEADISTNAKVSVIKSKANGGGKDDDSGRESESSLTAAETIVDHATKLINWICHLLDQELEKEKPLQQNGVSPIRTIQQVLLTSPIGCDNSQVRRFDFNLGEILESCLLRCNNVNIRIILSQMLENMSRELCIDFRFFEVLSKLAKTVGEKPELIPNCSEYFELISLLLQECITLHSNDCTEWMLEYADSLSMLIISHPIYERRSDLSDKPRGRDKALSGFMNVLKTLLHAMPLTDSMNLKQFLGRKRDLVEYVFFPCLYDIPNADNHGLDTSPPKCKYSETRVAAFFLLIELCTDCGSNLEKLLSLVANQHKQTPLVPLLMAGHISPTKIAPGKKLLVNKITPAKELLVNENSIPFSLFPSSIVDDDEYWRTKTLSDRERTWHFDPAAETRARCGYVGLRNLGCICYMNSLLQQLYMIPLFRSSILSAEIEDKMENNSKVDLLNRTDVNMKVEKDQEVERHNQAQLLLELQKMFCYLHESERKCYDTSSLCTNGCSLNYGKPIDVYQQQDVDEFFNVLMDQLEETLGKTQHKHVLKTLFGGVLCNEIICKEGCCHRSEREDGFMVLQLDVKGKSSIMKSLDSYVEGEMLEGDNKYLCGQCNEKRDAQKRTCIVQLPNVLILHLKRFEFDLEQLRKIKVNDLCEFPTVLDMEPYTREGLEKKENQDICNSSSSNIDVDDDNSVIGKRSRDYYEYNLVGVLVHSGTADCGHYYSYVKERTPKVSSDDSHHSTAKIGTNLKKDHPIERGSDNCRWICFNDEQVSPFDPANLAEMCFGGDSSSLQTPGSSNSFTNSQKQGGGDLISRDSLSPIPGDYNSDSGLGTPSHMTKVYNAYMLIYERKTFLNTKTSAAAATNPDQDKENQENANEKIGNKIVEMDISSYNRMESLLLEKAHYRRLYEMCWRENSEILTNGVICDNIYPTFVLAICDISVDENVWTQEASLTLFRYIMATVVHIKGRVGFDECISTLEKLLLQGGEKSQLAVLNLLEANGCTWIYQTLLLCTIEETREKLAVWFEWLFALVVKNERLLYYSPDEVLIKHMAGNLKKRNLINAAKLGKNSAIALTASPTNEQMSELSRQVSPSSSSTTRSISSGSNSGSDCSKKSSPWSRADIPLVNSLPTAATEAVSKSHEFGMMKEKSAMETERDCKSVRNYQEFLLGASPELHSLHNNYLLEVCADVGPPIMNKDSMLNGKSTSADGGNCNINMDVNNFDLFSERFTISQVGELIWSKHLETPSVWPVKSSLARIIGWMLAMLPECGSHWKKFEQFFQLLYKVSCMGVEEVHLMISLGAIPRLLEFILAEESPSVAVTNHNPVRVTHCDDSDYIPSRLERIGKRSKMGDQSNQPQLGSAVRLLCRLFLECRIPHDVPKDIPGNENNNADNDVSGNRENGQPVASWLDLQLLLVLPAFKRMLEQDVDSGEMEALCKHVCTGRWDTSVLVIDALCSGINDFSATSFSPLFGMLENIMEIKDTYSEKRIEYTMNELLKIIRYNYSYANATLQSLSHIRRFVMNGKFVKVRDFLCEPKVASKWVREWLVGHSVARVRHEAEYLIYDLCCGVDENIAGKPSATMTGSQTKTRLIFFDILRSIFNDQMLDEVWLTPDYASSMMMSSMKSNGNSACTPWKSAVVKSHLLDEDDSSPSAAVMESNETNPSPTLSSAKFDDNIHHINNMKASAGGENRAVNGVSAKQDVSPGVNKLSNNSNKSNSSLLLFLEPNCFRIATLFRTMARLLHFHRQHVEKNKQRIDRVKNDNNQNDQNVECAEIFSLADGKRLLEILIGIDIHQVECDYNKGELIRLWYHVLKDNTPFLQQVICSAHAEKALSLTMVVRPFDECKRFNECFAACYYSVFKELLFDPSTRLRALTICFEQKHLHWAFKYFLVCNTDYPRTAAPLRDIYELCMNYSRDWRMHSLNELIHQIPISQYISTLCVANRVYALKMLLGVEASSCRRLNVPIVAAEKPKSIRTQSESTSAAFVRGKHVEQNEDTNQAIFEARNAFVKGNGLIYATQLLGIHFSSGAIADANTKKGTHQNELPIGQVGVDILSIVHVSIRWILPQLEELSQSMSSLSGILSRIVNNGNIPVDKINIRSIAKPKTETNSTMQSSDDSKREQNAEETDVELIHVEEGENKDSVVKRKKRPDNDEAYVIAGATSMKKSLETPSAQKRQRPEGNTNITRPVIILDSGSTSSGNISEERRNHILNEKKAIEDKVKELKNVLKMWSNKKVLIEVAVKICFGTGQGTQHSSLSQLHRDAKFHSLCILKLMSQVESILERL